MISPLFQNPSAPGPHLTEDQARVLERITALGTLYFKGSARGCGIEPRLWPLIVGPTGCGKTHLSRLLAEQLGAHYLRLSYGDWIVQGARGTCTFFSILAAALRHPRLVIHLDELDKLPVRGEQEWARAAANEIWALLDLDLPVTRFVSDAAVREQNPPEALQRLADTPMRGRLFMVGSGTWQDLFDAATNSPRATLGFGGAGRGAARTADYDAALQRVVTTHGPMAELLARFDGAVQLIRPPTLPEALALLERIGARDYARRIHYDEVRVLRELLPRQGFRALQSVATELLLRGWNPRLALWPKTIAAALPRPVGRGQTEFQF